MFVSFCFHLVNLVSFLLILFSPTILTIVWENGEAVELGGVGEGVYLGGGGVTGLSYKGIPCHVLLHKLHRRQYNTSSLAY